MNNSTKNAYTDEPNPNIVSMFKLEEKLDALTREFEKFWKETNAVQRSRSQSRGRSQARKQNFNSSNLCYFHQKFGDDALKCRAPRLEITQATKVTRPGGGDIHWRMRQRVSATYLRSKCRSEISHRFRLCTLCSIHHSSHVRQMQDKRFAFQTLRRQLHSH